MVLNIFMLDLMVSGPMNFYGTVIAHFLWNALFFVYTVRIFYLEPPLVSKLLIEVVQDKISILYFKKNLHSAVLVLDKSLQTIVF